MGNMKPKFEIEGVFVCPKCGHDLSSIEDMPEIEKYLSEECLFIVRPAESQCPTCKSQLLFYWKAIKPIDINRPNDKGIFQRTVEVGSIISVKH